MGIREHTLKKLTVNSENDSNACVNMEDCLRLLGTKCITDDSISLCFDCLVENKMSENTCFIAVL